MMSMEHQTVLRVLEVMSVASLVPYCLNEARGQGLRYSKFAPTSQRRGGENEKRKKDEDRDDEQPSRGGSTSRSIPSRPAMFIAYFPSLLLSSSFLAAKLHVLPLPPPAAAAAVTASSSFLAFFEATDLRITVLAAAVAFHFLKRVLE